MEGSDKGGRDGSALPLIALVVGLIAAAIGLFSPALVYEIPLVLGIAALVVGLVGWRRTQKGRRGMAIAGTLLGALAVAAGVWGAVTVETTLGGLEDFEDFGEDPASKEREKFCNSDRGDELERLSSASSDSGRQLRRQTARALRAARAAPAGADCAVSALDSIASSWNIYAGDPGYRGAEMEVKRIRRFQRRNDLREPVF